MATNNQLRVRRSIQELQAEYDNPKGNKKPLEDLMRAWKGIKELPPDNPNSFFMIGGYHGEPFRGAGWGNASYWGGYCNHGNILFPTWHRVYLLRLEEALQSISGCEDVMLPYWDETSDDSLNNGIPKALTDEYFTFSDNVKIPNPLRSFVFNRNIQDNINGDNPNYSKPKAYETVRYPLSGLVGTEDDRKKTKEHNDQYPDYDERVKLLDQNIVTWLKWQVRVNGKPVPGMKKNVKDQYLACLEAPNYTVFSNTTSAAEWNTNLDDGVAPVVSLESPHNHIHLAVGGFDVPDPNQPDFSPIPGANGDMGENDTAALDPIFYFHHCFVDYVFWLWQKKHGFTDHLAIIEQYPGTNSVDSQGPTPGTAPNSWLTLASPLDPFKKKENGSERAYTSLDCINIEKDLGYTYSPGSLEQQPHLMALQPDHRSKVIRVSGINRAPISGSFLVAAYVNMGGKKHLVGTEAVLSRWSVQYCANCQTHLEVKAFFGLHGLPEDPLSNAVNDVVDIRDLVDIEIHTRDGLLSHESHPLAFVALNGNEKKPYRVEVR